MPDMVLALDFGTGQPTCGAASRVLSSPTDERMGFMLLRGYGPII
jgi:hypothetical protein